MNIGQWHLHVTNSLKPLPFQRWFCFGKSQKLQGTKSGLQRSWVTWVISCFTKTLCTRRDAWAGALSWWSCQSPVAHRGGLLNHSNTFCGGMFSLNTKFNVDSLLYLLILNAIATQYTCSLNKVYRPHWLVQCSHHFPRMSIPVYSPWLPGYIDIAQTILVILTMGTFSG